MLPVGKLTADADARPCRHRARARRRRYPPHGLAEPADLRRAGRQGRRRRSRASRRSALPPSASSIRAGLVACTGNAGCRFAASDTKRHAEEIARWCEARVELDGPVNIHLTGCHHSCAQHYIGDIGLIACKVRDQRRRRHGRGLSHPGRRRLRPGRRRSAREIYQRRARPRTRRATVERMLQGLSRASQLDATRRFLAFTRRHDVDALQGDVRGGGGMSAAAAPADRRARSGERAVHPRAAHLAQRLLRRPVSLDGARHAAVAAECRGADAGAQPGGGRRRRRRRALARPDAADRRAHEARRRHARCAAA